MLALTANANRDPKKHPKAFAAEQFNPYAERGAKRKRNDTVKLDPEQSVKALANVFGGKAREKGAH